MPYSIYALIDPRDQSIRYVGMSKDAKRRLQRHLSQKDNPLMPWFQGLAQERYKPTLAILETVESKGQAKERELYWIKHYADQGAHLENYQGNADSRDAWKKRQEWLTRLTDQYSFIKDQKEREFVISVFLEIHLTQHYHRIDNVDEIVSATVEVIQQQRGIDVTWTEIALIWAKIFHINVNKQGSREE